MVGSNPTWEELFSFYRLIIFKFSLCKKAYFYVLKLFVIDKKHVDHIQHMIHTKYEFMVEMILHRTVCGVVSPLLFLKVKRPFQLSEL